MFFYFSFLSQGLVGEKEKNKRRYHMKEEAKARFTLPPPRYVVNSLSLQVNEWNASEEGFDINIELIMSREKRREMVPVVIKAGTWHLLSGRVPVAAASIPLRPPLQRRQHAQNSTNYFCYSYMGYLAGHLSPIMEIPIINFKFFQSIYK